MFSLLVKYATIRIILSIAISKGCSLHQVDVNNAFLNGDLNTEVFMQQPPGYDLGALHYFLGIEVNHSSGCLHLCQRKYIRDIHDRCSMTNAKSIHTPLVNSSIMSKDDGERLEDSTEYRSLTVHPFARLSLIGYADANWGLDFDDRQSTSGYYVYFGQTPVSWCSKK
ncbi:hypothetical protein EPI10_024170 [Gossypium australe]|uniref:Reverse transcriptase Ty1/copia-type domain-containing protein n=1 Tax=Gossypium australe TaxID=47621 RepID=A0A5B6VX22_9ROSI|nr:hypothetical protein EPI10_024170 [Gossypium australe]